MQKAIYVIIVNLLFVLISCSTPKREVKDDSIELPLEPSRFFQIDTEEGTGMNMDVSPDGRTLVFDLLGNIFQLPVRGGEAQQITSGISWDAHPVWAPGGKEIAFLSDRSGVQNIWVMDTSGNNLRQVSHWKEGKHFNHNLEWFPEGDSLISGKDIYSLDGSSEPRKIDQIYGTVRISSNPEILFTDSFSIHAFDSKKDSVRLFYKGNDTISMSEPLLSPDGTKIAYVRLNTRIRPVNKNSLNLLDIKSGKEQVLVSNIGTARKFWERIDFSPDSKNIWIGYGGKIHKVNISKAKDTIIPFKASVKMALAPMVYYKQSMHQDKLTYLRYPDISPNGTSVVFTALSKIYQKDLARGKPHLLFDEEVGQFYPSYSPDGKQVVYATWDDQKGGDVRIIYPGNKTSHKISRIPGLYQDPVWSPDGKKIAVLKGEFTGKRNVASVQQGQLQLINLKDSTQVQLAGDIPMDNTLSFSSDGNKLYFLGLAKYPTAPRPVFQVDIATKKQIKIGEVPYRVQKIYLSPDRNFLAFRYDYKLYVSKLLKKTGFKIRMNDNEGSPILKIPTMGVRDVRWEDEGKSFYWIAGNTLYATDALALNSQFNEKDFQNKSIPMVSDKVISKVPISIILPKDGSNKITALVGAKILTMDKKEIIENGTILIRGKRIIAVGKRNEIKIPEGAKVKDVSGKTILPGYIDMHDHDAPPREVLVGEWQRYLVDLEYGVTTARDPSTHFDTHAYEELIHAGRLIGPRLFGVEVATDENDIHSYQDALDWVGNQKADGAKFIKVHDGFNRIQRQWLVKAANQNKMIITGHADMENIYENINLSMIQDGFTGWEHALPVGTLFDDVRQLIKLSGIWYTPTEVVESYSGIHYFYDKNIIYHANNYRYLCPLSFREQYLNTVRIVPESSKLMSLSKNSNQILNSGGHVLIGSHSDLPGVEFHFEMWALKEGGMSSIQILRAATIEAARGLGMDKELGSIGKGQLADLVVLNSDPLDNIRATMDIDLVIKDGKIYTSEDLSCLCERERIAERLLP